MDATIIKQLRAELAALEAEMARLTKQADNLRGTLAFYESRSDTTEAVQPAKTQPAKTLRDAAFDILEMADLPLHYAEIYLRLQERGVAVGGKNPASNVGAHMSGDARFENVGRGLWGLRRWTKQPLGGDPASVARHAIRAAQAGTQRQPKEGEGPDGW